jgi:transcriptional regulator with XRE-family HTH domain
MRPLFCCLNPLPTGPGIEFCCEQIFDASWAQRWFTGDMSDASVPTPPRAIREMDELFRRAIGRQLRELRLARGERLDDTALRAGISPQYLSEVERGRKDASSEMIAAVVGALETTLADVLLRVVSDLDSSRAEIIELRSSTGLRYPGPSGDSRLNGPTRASLSIAA